MYLKGVENVSGICGMIFRVTFWTDTISAIHFRATVGKGLYYEIIFSGPSCVSSCTCWSICNWDPICKIGFPLGPSHICLTGSKFLPFYYHIFIFSFVTVFWNCKRKSFIDLSRNKEHSQIWIIWLLSDTSLSIAPANWFAWECPEILKITNCLSCCMVSKNFATCFLFFVDFPEEVKKPFCFYNILKSWATQRHRNCQCIGYLIFAQVASLN